MNGSGEGTSTWIRLTLDCLRRLDAGELQKIFLLGVRPNHSEEVSQKARRNAARTELSSKT
jgi:hypothetical protein